MDLKTRLRGEGFDPGRWSNGPGDRYAAHDHAYDKVIVVEVGSITFRLDPDEAVDLDRGDRLEGPRGARRPHRRLLPRGALSGRLDRRGRPSPRRELVTALESLPG